MLPEVFPEIGNLSFPDELSRLRVDGEQMTVRARVDERAPVDRDIAGDVHQATVLSQVGGQRAGILPDQLRRRPRREPE